MSSISTTGGTKFGLSLAAKPKKTKRKLSNAFGADTEDHGEDEGQGDKNKQKLTYRERVNQEMRQKSAMAARQMDVLQARAAGEGDEAIYDYDSFATIKQEKETIQRREKSERESVQGGTSQYITGLMATAKAREKEKERVFDRKLIKEREEEEQLYGDLPKFVTSAYKAKLEEDKKFDEAEEAQAAEEGRRDKRQGMGVFLKTMINGGSNSNISRNNTSTTASEALTPPDEPKPSHPPASAPGEQGEPEKAELWEQADEERRRTREEERMVEVEAARQRYLLRKHARTAAGVWEISTQS